MLHVTIEDMPTMEVVWGVNVDMYIYIYMHLCGIHG